MMKRINLRRIATIAVVVVLLLAFAWVLSAPAQDAFPNRSVALLVPSFVSEASADPAAPANFLVDEAGMSAYFRASGPIVLDDVRDLFRTIEDETDHYIVGSMAMDDYDETYDVHVYIHTDGWVLTYYWDSNPASKMVDIKEYDNSHNLQTQFEENLAIVASMIGSVFPGATYYDFRYPNATNIMIVAELDNDPGSFYIELPPTFVFYERSYILDF